ncbi:hypothetical protein Tco_0084725 [Tanacetum coccineum]
MSLEESDDLNIPDAAPVDPVLEACALLKFDMHLYKFSLNESHVKYLVKLYGIPEDLHPQVVPEGMTMNALPPGVIGLYAHYFQQGGLRNRAGKDYKPCLKDSPTSLKKWKDKFFLVDRRAAPIAMAWRHHDSSVADPFPRPSEYNASDVAKLREVVISLRRPPLSILYVAGLSNVWKHASRAFSIKDSKGKVITMDEFLRLPNFKGCKVSAGTLLPPGAARVTHLAPPEGRLEDIPPKTGDMMVAELPCWKVLDDKEKKKRKAEEKAAAKIPAINIQAETVVNKDAGREGPRNKRRVRAGPQVRPDSEHVSSPTPLNHAKPLEALANEEHVSPPLSVGGQGNVDASYAIEGHGDNEGGLSGLQTRPNLTHHSGRRLDTVEEPAPENIMPDAEASYSAGRFGNLPFTPQWGLTDSSRMDNSRECRDMMAKLFTPADEEFFNEDQANTLLRFEALKEQHADLAYAHESCKYVKARYKECKKELVVVQSAYDGKVSAFDQLSKNYDGALTREKGLQDRLEELEEEKKEADQLNSSQADRIKHLEEALKQSEADAHQLRTEKERYAVEAGRGEMPCYRKGTDGISIGREDADVQAILKATPNVDPASSDTFMDAYEKLFDRRYPYVDKVARMYLLDPSGLQNIMPEETGPTPGGGPRDTPTASYA